MKSFVSDFSNLVWKLFEQTGSLNLYSLYSAVEHDKYKNVYPESFYSDSNSNDRGMEL